MTEEKKNKPFVDLLLSIVIPAVILMKFSGEDGLGPARALIVALSFPVGYFLFEYFQSRKTNLISVLGIFNVLLTGGVGLLELNPKWIAVKEAAVPGTIGIVVLFAIKSRLGWIRSILLNDAVIRVDEVNRELEQRGNKQQFDELLAKAGYLLALSFFLSSILNYVLAKMIVTTDPAVDMVAFNEELGKMTALSYPVIVVPSMVIMGIALWLLIKGVQRLTGLKWDQIINQNH